MSTPVRTDAPSPRFPGFEEHFERENTRLLVERARFLLWAALALYPAFWFLDLLNAPQLAFRFFLIRAAVCGLYLVVLGVVHSRYAARFVVPAVMLGALASATGISIMAADLGGFTSNYFVGIVIVIYVIGFFIPWSLPATVTFCTLTILIYLTVNAAAHGLSREAVPPLFFLVGTAVFTYLATLSSRRTRRRDLSLRLRLEKANEDLQELDEAKTRFFANVSHELRTPLTLLLGPLESLLTVEADPERRVLLESIGNNARRLRRQVDALLDLTKLEAGRLRLELAEDDLGELLSELVAAAAPYAARRGIRIVTEGLDDLPMAYIDRPKVEIIAANLVSNAVKFASEGGTIVVRGEAEDGRLLFEVEDDGPGIPEHQLEAVFERFHQIDSSPSREQAGTGLGLSLARELARLHGGDVTASSVLGRGATFRVELPSAPGLPSERRRRPRRREDQLALARIESLTAREYAWRSMQETLLADVEPPRLSRETLPPPEPPAGAPRVLLVDDNDDLRNFLAHRLSLRYQVETADGGEVGWEKAQNTRPDLVIADVMMPGVDGYELCRRLKQSPALATTPVILVTAKAGAEAVAEGLEVGADDYVTKPFALRELEARVAAHLRAKELERQLHERESRLAAIGQMTSGVVHDLRNPLTLIKGYADLAHAQAMEGVDPDTIAGELSEVRSAADRLRRMIEEILDFARGGAPELVRTQVPIRGYLERVLAPLAAGLEESGITVSLDLDLGGEVQATLDQDRFHRVLENLLKNAGEALATMPGDDVPQREKRVSVTARADDGSLILRVADTGPGIPEALAGQLFEPFTTTGKKRGTGLGLVTVRNLVKAHGGEIVVERRAPEGGAAFTIVLPLEA